MDEDMEVIETNYVKLTKDLLDQGCNPHNIATALIALSMNLYSELLSDEDHTTLLKRLYEQQKNKPLEKLITLH